MTADLSPSTPLAEVRQYLREHIDEGVKCPGCEQKAKVYRRRVHATMARTLIHLYRAGGSHTFVHGPSLPDDSHEISQLAWWGLAEEEKVRRPDGGRAGYWRCTTIGAAFVLGAMRIPKYARIYDGRCLGTIGEPVGIIEALGAKFDYGQLMSS